MTENIHLNKPKRFIPNKNHVAEDWRTWKEEFLIYLELAGVDAQLSEKQKAFLLLNLMGEEAIKARSQMSFTNPYEKDNMEILLMKFDDIFDPPTNEAEERYKFFSRYKNDEESIDDYVTVLKEQAKKCNFGNQVDKFIVDMIILNMNYYLQQQIFSLEDTSLLNVVLLYKQEAITEEKIKNMFLDESENSDFELQHLDKEKYNKKYQFDYEKDTKTTSNDVLKNSFYKKSTHTDDNNKIFQNYTNKLNASIEKNEKSINNSTKKETQNQHNKMFNSNNQSKSTCSICGSSHPTKKCPIYHQGEAMNATPKNYSHKSFVDNEQICQWCQLRHDRGKCLHDPNCTTCDKFPHNVCFQCRKNPHDDNCYYKLIITLPEVVSSYNNRFNSDIPFCFLCGTMHLGATCPTQRNNKCYRCNNFGHLTDECPLSRNYPNRQNVNPGTNSAGPSQHTNRAKTKRVCSKCGTIHSYMQCPAYNKTCSKCGNLGHYNWTCKNQSRRQKYSKQDEEPGCHIS